MIYTLTSAATLGYDLVRLPGGRQAAGVVLAALRSGPDEWALLAGQHPLRSPDPAADPVLAAVDAASARELASHQTGPAEQGDHDGPATAAQSPAALAEQLRGALIGSAASLEALLRHEVLDLTAPASGDEELERALAFDVLCDAAVAAHAARELPRALRRRLSEPYEHAVAGAAFGTFDLAPDPAAPWGPSLRVLLGALRELDAGGRSRWRAAVGDLRAQRPPWATTMHDACWAAHAAGRVPAAAAAQMLAVQAFLDAGFTTDDGASGVWNAVSGCVQGLLLADLMGSDALDVLTAPWALATGEALLTSG